MMPKIVWRQCLPCLRQPIIAIQHLNCSNRSQQYLPCSGTSSNDRALRLGQLPDCAHEEGAMPSLLLLSRMHSDQRKMPQLAPKKPNTERFVRIGYSPGARRHRWFRARANRSFHLCLGHWLFVWLLFFLRLCCSDRDFQWDRSPTGVGGNGR